MLEPAITVLSALVVGGLAGVLSSVMGWLGGSEAFNARKFATAAITGVLSGIAVGVGVAQSGVLAEATTDALIIQLTLVFLSVLGVDFTRNKVSNMVGAGAGPQKPASA